MVDCYYCPSTHLAYRLALFVISISDNELAVSATSSPLPLLVENITLTVRWFTYYIPLLSHDGDDRRCEVCIIPHTTFGPLWVHPPGTYSTAQNCYYRMKVFNFRHSNFKMWSDNTQCKCSDVLCLPGSRLVSWKHWSLCVSIPLWSKLRKIVWTVQSYKYFHCCSIWFWLALNLVGHSNWTC